MDSTIIVALISFAGTVVGTALGMLAGTKLTTYRIEQLEKKVQAHNEVVERTCILEGQVTELHHDVRDLKELHKKN